MHQVRPMVGEATVSRSRSEMPMRRPRPARRFGEYAVLAQLARGGTGDVFLAANVETGERVALKVLDARFANHAEITSRLFAEHQIASSVRHPGLLEIRDAQISSDGLPYLVMEHLSGETLGDLADRRKLELAEIVDICAQVASALAALHAAGIMHGDVKHENVFVVPDHAGGAPRVKIIDFGVSRRLSEPFDDAASIAGTPWCMAPEQWQGHPEAASDVYALGCLLYDLTTGLAPFDGSLLQLMAAHLEQRPPRPTWLAKMPTSLERLILRALAKQPADRPSMAGLARELHALADSLATAPELRAAG
jgi:eukaryotic-like serine/threonine-protein kinase